MSKAQSAAPITSARRRRWAGVGAFLFLLSSSCAGTDAKRQPSAAISPSVSPSSPQLSKAAGVPALVTRVIDGDTIEVRVGNRLVDVRLIGMDTPESVHPTVADECFGAAAARYARTILENQEVVLTFDVERRDLYDRTLAYVWIDDELFNAEIVRAGYAQSYTVPPNVLHAEEILHAQREARRSNVGLWNKCIDSRKRPPSTPHPQTPIRPCTRGYRPCLPPASDYDCSGGEGDGPKYVNKTVRVSGDDPYRLDEDGDGHACGGS